MLDIIKSMLYGIIQGLAEFLPVSSSGHIAIFKNIFGLPFDGAHYILYTLILHLGSLVAVFIIYFQDIKKLVISFFTLIAKIFTGKFKYASLNSGERFVILIFIATLPLVIGAFIDKQIENLADSTKIIGLFLIINAVILFFSDMINDGNITEKTAAPKNAIFVGLCQLIAVAPGISRMGATVTGGILNGFDRQTAVRFSFIMSIPAILGASVFKIGDFVKSEAAVTGSMIASCIIGFVFAFISGIIAIVLLNMIARRKNFSIFSIYCFIVGIIALIWG